MLNCVRSANANAKQAFTTLKAPTKLYAVDTPAAVKTTPLLGTLIDLGVDVTRLRVGDEIETPYELTINASVVDFWASAFYSHDRINTSTPFARRLGFQDSVLPFSLMLFLCGSMSHMPTRLKYRQGFKIQFIIGPRFRATPSRKNLK